MPEPLPSTQYTIAQAVHPVLLQMAQERALPERFETRAELVNWLRDMVRESQLDVIRWQQRLEGARKNCAYWEAELLAQNAILTNEQYAEQAKTEDKQNP